MSDSQKNLRYLLIILVFIFAFFIGLTIYKDLKFRVVSTNPSTSNVANVSPFFEITFNHQLSGKSSVTSTPAIISTYKIKGKVLDINLNYPLKLNKTYKITVLHIQDSSGHTIVNKTFSFTTKDIPTDDLSTSQQKALLNNQSRYSESFNDPILKYIPYSTLEYNLSPSYTTDAAGHTKIIIQAQLIITAADSDTPQDRQAAINQGEQEVQQYIQSKGINPTNYTIDYTY